MRILSLLLMGLAVSAWAQSDLIKIVDKNNKAIEGAEILVGWAVDDPFKNNFITTDKNGEAEIPAEWLSNNTELPITINSDGYIRRTFYGQAPTSNTFTIEQRELKNRVEMSGKTTNFSQMKNFDGLVDFGLVIPGLRRTDMLTFDMGRVISPEIDTISIVGQQIDLPSNLTLPKQRERYFISITFDKPRYRTFFSEVGDTKAFALHGRFPLQKVAGKLRNGDPFFEVLNDVEFVSGAHHDLTISAKGIKSKQLDVNNVSFKKRGTKTTAPSFNKRNIMIAATLSDVDGYLFPSDLKTVESGQSVDLQTAKTAGDKYLLRTVQPRDVLTNKRSGDDRPLTATLDKLSNGSKLDFVNFVGQPKIVGDDFVLDKPKAAKATTPIGTVVTLSDIETKKNGKLKVEIKRRSWELFAEEWQSSLQVPVWPGAFTPMSSKRRLEVMYLGGSANTKSKLGPNMINDSTHVVYNKRDI